MRLLVIVLILVISSCTEPTLQNTLNNKVAIFEKYETTYFNNLSITPLSREPYQKSPKEFEIRKKGKPGFAVIQTVPEIRILKNYYSDSLSIDFVKAFAELDVTWLHNFDVNKNDSTTIKPVTHLEFHFGKDNIVLFRENSYHLGYDKVISEKSILLNGKWRYSIFPINPK